MRTRAPHVTEALARDVAEAVARLREMDLAKLPGVAETIDWANALAFLGADRLTEPLAADTLGSVVKDHEDQELVDEPALTGRRRRRRRWLTPSRPVRFPSSSRSAASCARGDCPWAPGASSRSSRAVAALGLTDRDVALLGRPDVAGGAP